MPVDLRLEGLRVSVGRGKKKQILNGLDLHAPSGQTTVVMGDSGSGKTTLLRAVAGLAEVEAGEVRFGSRTVTRDAPGERNVALAFQSYALYPGQSVERNLMLPLEAEGVAEDERERRVRSTLEYLGMWGHRHQNVDGLSGGEQQRVSLGRALVRRPSLLLLDEPLSNVDPARRQEIVKLLHEYLDEHGVTTLLVTHDWEEACLLGDRIAVIDGGRLVQAGTPREIYMHPKTLKVLNFSQQGMLNQIRMERAGEREARGASDISGGLRARSLQAIGREEFDLVFRSEHLVAREGGFPARIRALRPMAGTMLLDLDVSGRRLFGSGPLREGPEVGESVPMTLLPGHAWLASDDGELFAEVRSLEVAE